MSVYRRDADLVDWLIQMDQPFGFGPRNAELVIALTLKGLTQSEAERAIGTVNDMRRNADQPSQPLQGLAKTLTDEPAPEPPRRLGRFEGLDV
jgi:hypothetical protein